MSDINLSNGVCGPDKTRRSRLKKAKKLRSLVKSYRHGRLPPGARKGLCCASICTVVIVWVGIFIADLPLYVVVVSSTFVMVTVLKLVWSLSAFQTVNEHLYDRLADYEPFDLEGYNDFQMQARYSNNLDRNQLLDWLTREVDALDSDKPMNREQIRLNQARKRFIEAGSQGHFG